MRAWRIYPHTASYARSPGFDPLSGTGGLIAAGRWNHPGQPVTYCALNPSLAVLETAVRVTSTSRFGTRTLLEIILPASVEEVTREEFSKLLTSAPPEDPQLLTRDFGTKWLMEQRSLALLAPSAVVPQDRIVVLNPLHSDAVKIEISGQELVRLDSRLLHLEDPQRS